MRALLPLGREADLTRKAFARRTLAASTLKLCGQIKNGPYDAWSTYLKNGKLVKLTGSVWVGRGLSPVPGSVQR